MKKMMTYAVLLLAGLSLGTVQAAAETAFQPRLAAQVTRAVQKSVKAKIVPQKAKTSVQVKWTNYDEAMYNSSFGYSVGGSSFNTASCSAILCNYKDEKDAGVVTVAFDKNCFNSVLHNSGAESFLFTVNLGQFGRYATGELRGEPYYFEMEVRKTAQAMNPLFHLVKAKSGRSMYLFNMPVRSSTVKNALKTFFSRQGKVSVETAANTLSRMQKPTLQSQFSAN